MDYVMFGMAICGGLIVILLVAVSIKSSQVSCRLLESTKRVEQIKCDLKGLPRNDIRVVLANMHAERLSWIATTDPRYFRLNCIPPWCRDIKSYCRMNNINPIYPSDWNGVRLQQEKS